MISDLGKALVNVRRVNPRAYFNALIGYAGLFCRAARPYSLPWKLDLVLTKACNLRCTFCISYESLGSVRWMDFALYERIARTLFPSAHSVFFCSGGEPLLYPRIRDALRLARDYRTSTTMVSNGTLLNRETARWMVADRSLHDLFISFDGAKKETLERIRRGANFETILGNIDFLSVLKKKQGISSPRLSFHYIVMKSNAEELPDIFRICSQYGVERVKVGCLNVTENMDVRESLFFHQELAADVFAESRRRAREWGVQLQLPALPGPVAVGRGNRCPYPWQFTMIEPDGSVRFCYHAWRQRLGFFGDEFMSIWRGDNYQKIRRTVNSREPYYPYCRYCSVRVGPHLESSHNQMLHAESYIIPGLEHLQTHFNDRSEENIRSFTEFKKPTRLP